MPAFKSFFSPTFKSFNQLWVEGKFFCTMSSKLRQNVTRVMEAEGDMKLAEAETFVLTREIT